jgi:hypothetical protein
MNWMDYLIVFKQSCINKKIHNNGFVMDLQ